MFWTEDTEDTLDWKYTHNLDNTSLNSQTATGLQDIENSGQVEEEIEEKNYRVI